MQARLGIFNGAVSVFTHAPLKGSFLLYLPRYCSDGPGTLEVKATRFGGYRSRKNNVSRDVADWVPDYRLQDTSVDHDYPRCHLMDITLERAPGGYSASLPHDSWFPWPDYKTCAGYTVEEAILADLKRRLEYCEAYATKMRPIPERLLGRMCDEARRLEREHEDLIGYDEHALMDAC